MDPVIGIIAEYNPFHNGHEWQIKQCRKMFANAPVIVVMSGHFTQRGYPALLDKWQRAQMAVYGGADLVLELPFLAACKSAEFFAFGAIVTLNATGVVSHLCFGTECENTADLTDIAKVFAQANFVSALKEELKTGISYAAAIESSLKNFLPGLPEGILAPNNILAIEYIKALQKTNAKIRPVAIKRNIAQYLDSEIQGSIASATAIRQRLINTGLDKKVLTTLPARSSELLAKAYAEKKVLCDLSTFEKLIFYRLWQLEASQIAQIADVSEGMENLIKKASLASSNLSQLCEQATSKRYHKTRIMRALCQLLVLNGNKKQDQFVPYLRILAFNNRGREIIKKIRSKTVLPVITNLPDFYNKTNEQSIKNSLKIDSNATDIYQLLLDKTQSGLDFRQMPIYIDN